MSEIHPLEMRDMLQKPCQVCGKPTKQQYVTASHRGNFRHGGSKLTVRPVGETCQCKVKLVCNECGQKRMVSAEGNYNERCPKCGGVDWDVQ